MKTSVAMFRKYRSSIHFTQRRQLKRKNPENKLISSCQNEFLMQSLISYEFLFLFYGVSFSQSSQEREGHFEGSLSNSSCSCNCTLQYLRAALFILRVSTYLRIRSRLFYEDFYYDLVEMEWILILKLRLLTEMVLIEYLILRFWRHGIQQNWFYWPIFLSN